MSCCPTLVKPVESAYVRKGFGSYLAGTPGTTTKGIVLIPDIFGNHPNAYHLADVLAANGYLVVMPDLFPDGTAWPTKNWPADFDSAEWQAFYGRVSKFDNFLGDVATSAQLLRSLGCTTIGTVGLCWGAKVSLAALKAGIVSVCCGPHPSFLTLDDVKDAKGPIALIMSKDEGPFLDVKEELETNAFAAKNVFVRFDDLFHGFLGARGPFKEAFAPFTDDAVAARVAEASEVVMKFLKNTM